ncbi:MAG: alpha/beta hydrolase family protein [Solirubrobacteraceae bacterium]
MPASSNASLAYNFLFTRGRVHRYGPHRSQIADLHLPAGGGPHPVVVLIHGGSWRSRYGKRVMRALAADLVRRGCAAWNIEYRRVGEGGGWPDTFSDVAAAIDHLATLDAPLDLEQVTVAGHSAGGHLALWAASRTRLPAGAPGAISADPALPLRSAVSMSGVCDLEGAFRTWHGGAALDLMGVSPDRDPARWAAADPRALAPAPVPVLLLHGRSDEVVTIRLSRDYAEAARAAGGDVTLVELDGLEGSHRASVYPTSEAWRTAVDWLGPGAHGAGRDAGRAAAPA